MQTPKHIHNAIANTLRSVSDQLTTPQAKSVKEILIGILKDNTPILNHINMDCVIKIVKQSERYR